MDRIPVPHYRERDVGLGEPTESHVLLINPIRNVYCHYPFESFQIS
jgi:hypothetical protein